MEVIRSRCPISGRAIFMRVQTLEEAARERAALETEAMRWRLWLLGIERAAPTAGQLLAAAGGRGGR
jgi:hypothetical protein